MSNKDIAIPGTIMNSPGEKMQAGNGTFWNGQDVVANIVGLRNQRGGYMNLIPMGGRYIPRPRKNDLVIGIITDTAQSYWTVDINSPYTAMLHVNDTPWRVDFGETVRYLNIGDVLIAKISGVGELRKVFVSIKEKGLRRLESGHIISMSPSKVPRVIGKKGSMLSMLKAFTNCRIFVGQNGRLWVEGDRDKILVLEEAVRRIEAMSHMPGLTTEIEAFLRSRLGEPSSEYGDPDHGRDDRREEHREHRDESPDRREEPAAGRAGSEAEEPAAEETVEKAAVEEVVEEPAAEETVEKVAVEEIVEEPAAEETVEKAAVEEVVEEPAPVEGAETEAPVITIVGSNGEPAEATPGDAGETDVEFKEKNEMNISEEEGD